MCAGEFRSSCRTLVLPFAFMYWPLPDGDDWPTALYHTLLRIFVLSAAGAVAATCVRLYRAHLHLVEKTGIA